MNIARGWRALRVTVYPFCEYLCILEVLKNCETHMPLWLGGIRVRTWALICGGISTLLVSIFARTLDRFILSLAGSEDMRCVKRADGIRYTMEVKGLCGMRWRSKVGV